MLTTVLDRIKTIAQAAQQIVATQTAIVPQVAATTQTATVAQAAAVTEAVAQGQAKDVSVFMPAPGTKMAAQVDDLYAFILWASFIALILLIGGMIYFVYKYRHREGASEKTPRITHNLALELTWSLVPLAIFLFVFAWGWYLFHGMRTVPKNALEIHVFGKQWLWEFAYKSGKKSVNELVVPLGKPVKLIMNSKDVLHSFFIPSFRIKQDVLPGRYTYLWFTAEKEGDFSCVLYRILRYCSLQHVS